MEQGRSQALVLLWLLRHQLRGQSRRPDIRPASASGKQAPSSHRKASQPSASQQSHSAPPLSRGSAQRQAAHSGQSRSGHRPSCHFRDGVGTHCLSALGAATGQGLQTAAEALACPGSPAGPGGGRLASRTDPELQCRSNSSQRRERSARQGCTHQGREGSASPLLGLTAHRVSGGRELAAAWP